MNTEPIWYDLWPTYFQKIDNPQTWQNELEYKLGKINNKEVNDAIRALNRYNKLEFPKVGHLVSEVLIRRDALASRNTRAVEKTAGCDRCTWGGWIDTHTACSCPAGQKAKAWIEGTIEERNAILSEQGSPVFGQHDDIEAQRGRDWLAQVAPVGVTTGPISKERMKELCAHQGTVET